MLRKYKEEIQIQKKIQIQIQKNTNTNLLENTDRETERQRENKSWTPTVGETSKMSKKEWTSESNLRNYFCSRFCEDIFEKNNAEPVCSSNCFKRGRG